MEGGQYAWSRGSNINVGKPMFYHPTRALCMQFVDMRLGCSQVSWPLDDESVFYVRSSA